MSNAKALVSCCEKALGSSPLSSVRWPTIRTFPACERSLVDSDSFCGVTNGKPKLPPFCPQLLGERDGRWEWIVTQKSENRWVVSECGFSPILFPKQIRPDGDPKTFRDFPLK